jgi:hypothetical protein
MFIVSKEVNVHQIITQQQFLLLIHIIVWMPVVGIDRTSMSHKWIYTSDDIPTILFDCLYMQKFTRSVQQLPRSVDVVVVSYCCIVFMCKSLQEAQLQLQLQLQLLLLLVMLLLFHTVWLTGPTPAAVLHTVIVLLC